MRKAAIRVLDRLYKGPASIKELSRELGVSYPAMASTVKSLVTEGLCERTNGSIRIKPTPQTQLLGKILTGYNGRRLLGGVRENILTSIIEPATIPQIAKRTGLAEQTIYRNLRELKSMLGVSVEKNYYSLVDEGLKRFLELRRTEKTLMGEEGEVTIIYSDGIILKRAPKGLRAKGTLTAFSRFHDFGVDYGAEFSDYYVEPPTDPSIEDVLIHALLASQTALEATMCAVFYLKNREKVDVGKVERTAKRLGALDMWLDLVALSRAMPLKNPRRFLPWDEFVQKAEVYDVRVEPPFKLRKVNGLFMKLGAKLVHEVTAYCLGGVNLMLMELKEATKDVDLVVEDQRSFKDLHQALLGLGYRTLRVREQGEQERGLEASGIYTHESLPRVDLFTRRICKAFELTDGMKAGAKSTLFGRFELRFLSLETVFLLKSITGRDGDLLDMEAIARRGLDWKVLERLYWEEEKLVGGSFCLDVLDSLEVIQKRSGTQISFIRRLLRRCVEEGVKQSAGLGARSLADLRRYLDFPEATLRRAVEELASRGELKLTKRKGRISLELPHGKK